MTISNIKQDATIDRHTAFFTQAMQKAYDQCKEDSGMSETSQQLIALC